MRGHPQPYDRLLKHRKQRPTFCGFFRAFSGFCESFFGYHFQIASAWGSSEGIRGPTINYQNIEGNATPSAVSSAYSAASARDFLVIIFRLHPLADHLARPEDTLRQKPALCPVSVQSPMPFIFGRAPREKREKKEWPVEQSGTLQLLRNSPEDRGSRLRNNPKSEI